MVYKWKTKCELQLLRSTHRKWQGDRIAFFGERENEIVKLKAIHITNCLLGFK
ncbi:MAG: hypothetical protein Ct9H90mP20_3160 [Candidatus Neomarinimicrobiota bacterium]|nr:MAG: hypothetical protein Ct9H90mP20_3160 [Candidatus Neomarinimicrobiota bacterium]